MIIRKETGQEIIKNNTSKIIKSSNLKTSSIFLKEGRHDQKRIHSVKLKQKPKHPIVYNFNNTKQSTFYLTKFVDQIRSLFNKQTSYKNFFFYENILQVKFNVQSEIISVRLDSTNLKSFFADTATFLSVFKAGFKTEFPITIIYEPIAGHQITCQVEHIVVQEKKINYDFEQVHYFKVLLALLLIQFKIKLPNDLLACWPENVKELYIWSKNIGMNCFKPICMKNFDNQRLEYYFTSECASNLQAVLIDNINVFGNEVKVDIEINQNHIVN